MVLLLLLGMVANFLENENESLGQELCEVNWNIEISILNETR
jgi:hypothetical protein